MQDIVQTEKRAGGTLRLFIIGVLTITATVIANLVVRALAFAIWPISPVFLPLQVESISFFTIILVGSSVLVYAGVLRFSKQPSRTYAIIALSALLLSFIPNALLFFNPDTRMWPGVTPLATSILIALHIVDAIIVIVMLTRLVPSKDAHPLHLSK